MASTPRDYPTTYWTADTLLGKRSTKRLSGTATELCRASDDTIQVIYHWTAVVTFHRDGSVVLSTGGWHTPTTARKMNACLYGTGYVVASDKGTLKLYRNGQWLMDLDKPQTLPNWSH